MDSFLTEPLYLTETGQNENGERELELDPPPELIESGEITLDIAYRVLFALQCDPEEVLFEDGVVEIPERPPMAHVQAIFDLLVKNQEDYEIPQMHPTEVQVFLATITDHFIHASHAK